MTTTIERGLALAPAVVRAPFGLETVADVTKHDEAHWAAAGGYRQENGLCHYVSHSWEVCSPDQVTSLFDGDSDEDVWQQLDPFIVQVEDTCKETLAIMRAEARERVMDLLEVLTWKAAEHELWYGTHTQAAEAVAGDRNPYLEDPNGVSVGTGMEPIMGLAAVEERLANLLPGIQGVIHMTHGTAVVLSSGGALEADGKVMRVKGTGTPVVVGSGYSDTNDVGSTIHGTGPIAVHVGLKKMLTDDLTQGFDWRANAGELRAERPVSVSWDGCFHVKAGITY